MWNCRKCWTPIYYKPTPLDRVCDQCLDSTDMSNRSAQARIAELEQRNAELEKELATLKETAADANYIAAIPALCRGEEVPCALHVSQPINELRARIAALEKMVRKYVSKCKLYGICSGITDDGYASGRRCSLCIKALALLQPDAGKEVGK